MPGRPSTGCRYRSLIVAFCGLVLVTGACAEDDDTVTTSAGSTSAAAMEPGPVLPSLEGVLTVGQPFPIVEGNLWKADDTYARFGPTELAVGWSPRLFTWDGCGGVAAVDSPDPVWDGERWTISAPLREGVVWSDGEPVTADDYLFTTELIEDLGLGGFWLEQHPIRIPDDPDTPEDEEVRWIESVHAPDPHTVEIILGDELPDPVTYGNLLSARIMPEHFWGPIVEACRDEDDPKACLCEADATGEPSAAAFMVESWGSGEVTLAANPDSYWRGVTETHYANGAITATGGPLDIDQTCGVGDPEDGHVLTQWQVGPFVEKVRIIGYDSYEAALDAFIRGDIDYVMYGAFFAWPEAYRERILNLPDIQVAVNPVEVHGAISFNLRKAPMDDLAFRQALAYVIDREAILADAPESGIPAYSLISPYIPAWHTDDVNHWGRGMTDPERLDAAVQVLEDAGYTWTARPQAVRDADGDYTGEIIDGEGLTQPDGTLVPDLDYLAPADKRLRCIAGDWVSRFAARLGITITLQPTDLETIFELVGEGEGLAPEDGLAWDMVNLATDSPPRWPCGAHQWMFDADNDVAVNPAPNAGNITGYINPEFEALSDALDAATSIEEARPICAAMEANIANNVPIIVLWNRVVTDFWRDTIELPDTTLIGGTSWMTFMLAKVHD